MIKQVFSILLLLILLNACNQNNVGQTNSNNLLLLSGPFLGYTEHFEQLVFMELTDDVKSVKVEYWAQNKPESVQTIEHKTKFDQKFNPFKVIVNYLEKGTKYEYRLFLNDIEQQIANNTFNTKKLWEWRLKKEEGPPPFSFLFGSCVFINDSTYDRPGEPYGKDYSIFDTMATHSTDFTLWGGDNREMRLETLSRTHNTMPYVFFTNLSKRVKRVYINE